MENLYLSNIFCMSELIYLIQNEKIYDTKEHLCNGKSTNWKFFSGCLRASHVRSKKKKKLETYIRIMKIKDLATGYAFQFMHPKSSLWYVPP